MNCARALKLRLGLFAVLMLLLAACNGAPKADSTSTIKIAWTPKELTTLKSLSLSNLPRLPADPSNHLADDAAAAAFGNQMFFDTQLSANLNVSCASCHQPNHYLTDGLTVANGVGTITRHTPSIMAAMYSPFQFWDGRADSLWMQALGPIENVNEHGFTRNEIAHTIFDVYSLEYEKLFGPLPDLSDFDRFPDVASPVTTPDDLARWNTMAPTDQDAVNEIFVNVGKSIAAYERTFTMTKGRFDNYVDDISKGGPVQGKGAVLSDKELAGLKLFIGDAGCTSCHKGPFFTDNSFHNTGIPIGEDTAADSGRLKGIRQLQESIFNCRGPYSDAKPDQCRALNNLPKTTKGLERAYKVPSLRAVAERPPYMHSGQFANLDEVLNHYNTAPAAPAGTSEVKPLNLSGEQLGYLKAFLATLDSDPVLP